MARKMTKGMLATRRLKKAETQEREEVHREPCSGDQDDDKDRGPDRRLPQVCGAAVFLNRDQVDEFLDGTHCADLAADYPAREEDKDDEYNQPYEHRQVPEDDLLHHEWEDRCKDQEPEKRRCCQEDQRSPPCEPPGVQSRARTAKAR